MLVFKLLTQLHSYAAIILGYGFRLNLIKSRIMCATSSGFWYELSVSVSQSVASGRELLNMIIYLHTF